MPRRKQSVLWIISGIMGIIIDYFSDDNITNKNKIEDDFLKPKFYGSLEGPVYTSLNYNKTYAIRHYEKSLWVSTIIQGDFEDAWKRGVPRLLKYFNGSNQKKWHLPSTCPVLIKKQCHAGNGEDVSPVVAILESQKLTVSMYVSKFFHEDPPGPSDSQVFLEEEYKRINLTGYYHGDDNRINDITETKDELCEMLRRNNESFDDGAYYLTVYSAKKSFKKQKYFEIWFKGIKLEEDYKCIKTYAEGSGDESTHQDDEEGNNNNMR